MCSEYGNFALNPEEAHGWEAGVEQQFLGLALTFGATWFDRITAGQIIFNSCSPTTPNPLCFVPDDSARRSGYYSNVTRGEAHGIEAAAALTLGALTLDGNYSWIVAEDRSPGATNRSEEHTSELQSLMRISYAVFCLTKKKPHHTKHKQYL